MSISGYKIGDEIHKSHRSVIYHAVRKKDNLPVIIKTLRATYPTHRDISRIKHEYQIIRNLKLQGVAHAYELKKHNNSLASILEYIKGESLKNFIKSNTIEINDFLLIAAHITAILNNIHKENVIHKDINPGNIVIDPETYKVKIIDFGLSTLLQREEHGNISPGSLEGTLAYISPEQTGRMNRAIDYRTDFYSLGVTFYEMLTGTLPFKSTDPMELVHCHIARDIEPPAKVCKDIPSVVSLIVMKLLSKNAEDRYQSAYGLKSDLDECLRQFSENGEIKDITAGSHDINERFNLSQKLYGRESDIDTLMRGFERASKSNSSIMLITGYSGVGKSALVNEVHKPIVKQNGYFITGKFDQYKRNIPYSALGQAFQGLTRQLLTESEESLKDWKKKLLDALGPNVQVIIDVIYEVEHITGSQPPVPLLGPQETQNRFNLVFQQFIDVFTREEHPLVLFLDDLQWVDLASLNTLKVLMTESDGKHLFVIGAYRDNEVDEHHPLLLTLDEMQKAGSVVNIISLSPLNTVHVNQLISDTLHCSHEQAMSLSEMVMDKTDGNPFFVKQFLQSLYEEGLIAFRYSDSSWQWNLDHIKKMDITDNVVELMAGKIRRLSDNTGNTLQLAACVGNRFDLKTLSVVNEISYEETVSNTREGVKEGMVVPVSDFGFLISDCEGNFDYNVTGNEVPIFKFLHDRIQQAAYSLISEEHRTLLHLNIGRLILKNSTQEEIEEKIFDIVNHLNIGSELITDPEERVELAKLNHRASTKANGSAAYDDALKFSMVGMGLLGKSRWSDQYELSHSLHEEGADAAYLSSNYQKVEELAEEVLEHAETVLDRVKAYETRILAFVAQNMMEEAKEMTLDILRQLGVSLPERPGIFHILREVYMTKWILRGKTMEDLKNLPQMTNRHKLAIMRITVSSCTSFYSTSSKYLVILICRMTILSAKYGNSPFSPIAYAGYGTMLCNIGRPDDGYRFGILSQDLAKRHQSRQYFPQSSILFNFLIRHWKTHYRDSIKPLLVGYQVGIETGDFDSACGCATAYSFFLLISGLELKSSEDKMAKYQEAAKKLKQKRSFNFMRMPRQVALNLIGKSVDPCRLVGGVFNEDQQIPIYTNENDYSSLGNIYIFKLMLSYLFGNYRQALDNALTAGKYNEAMAGQIVTPIYNLYYSLTLLMLYPDSQNSEQKQHLKRVRSNQKQMKKWAHHAPMNYLHKYYLVEAELARVKGKDMKAINLYDKAISLAKENEYISEEALANEVAARYYLSRVRDKIAGVYMKDARYCYYHWGAQAKVDDLKNRYPKLLTEESLQGEIQHSLSSITSASTETTSNFLDLNTVMKTSQVITGEIMLHKLLEKIMKILLENTGAQKGLLIKEKEGRLVIEAERDIEVDKIAMLQSTPIETSNKLSVPIINYIWRTRETVVLDDAAHSGMFMDEEYVKRTQQKSILCMPMINQGRLIGALYLENRLTRNVFASERLELLKILSAQIAASIENAFLYNTLEHKIEERTLELKVANERLNELDKMKTDFMSTVSHELRTPLTLIVGFAQITSKKFENVILPNIRVGNDNVNKVLPQIKENFGMIKQEGKRLSNLIDDFLDIVKIEAGAVEWNMENISMKKIVERASSITTYLFEHNELEQICDIEEGLPDVMCDNDRLIQVVINLISNAVKFTESGSVSCSVRRQENEIVTSIKDTGIGIANNDLERVFEKFSQVHRTLTDKPKGTGLGLSICKHIVEKHGGKIWAEGERGTGSTFLFTIPISQNNKDVNTGVQKP